MVASEYKLNLPSTDELPCSDDIPVDNEAQNFLPNLLLFMLNSIWKGRMDWYFGVDMGVYHTTGITPYVPVVPDAFLSLNVERYKGEDQFRNSYAVWEENEVVPTLVLEMVSHHPGGEYDEKLELYRKLGVLYYVIYNPEFWQRDQHQSFEVYKLVDETYQLLIGEPFWMPEVGLGIGRCRSTVGDINREILAWFDADNKAYPTPNEVESQLVAERQRSEAEYQRAEVEHQRAEAEYQRAERLVQQLRSLGFDPDNLPPTES